MSSSTPQPLHIETTSETQTHAVGQALGEVATAGLVVALNGNLGAGKTRFVQGVAAGLGIDRSEVNSPTFVLIHEYHGRLPVYHFDTYRLRDTDEFLELGADDYMAGDGVCLIEWADRMIDVLPRDRLTIQIAIVGESDRRLDFTAGGPRSQLVVNALAQRLG